VKAISEVRMRISTLPTMISRPAGIASFTAEAL
jgi:hypothetical protein